MPGDDGRQIMRRADAQLLVDVVTTENNFDVASRHAELAGQEAHHVIGRPAGHGRRRDADLQLLALGLADGVAAGVRRAENVEDQRLAIHGAERVKWHAFVAVGRNVAGFSGFGFHRVAAYSALAEQRVKQVRKIAVFNSL